MRDLGAPIMVLVPISLGTLGTVLRRQGIYDVYIRHLARTLAGVRYCPPRTRQMPLEHDRRGHITEVLKSRSVLETRAVAPNIKLGRNLGTA